MSLPRLRWLEDEPRSNGATSRQHVFVFTPPPYGPQQIGIQFPRYTPFGQVLTKALIVDVGRQPADRVLERGELLIVTADNVLMLRFIEASALFQRTGKAEGRQKPVSPISRGIFNTAPQPRVPSGKPIVWLLWELKR